jgi:hypothetical protein
MRNLGEPHETTPTVCVRSSGAADGSTRERMPGKSLERGLRIIGHHPIGPARSRPQPGPLLRLPLSLSRDGRDQVVMKRGGS